MLPPQILDEQNRLDVLRRYKILDTTPEEAFDDLVHMAALICRAPISLISLVDATRQWFKAKKGLEANELPRETAFCAHAIVGYDLLVVPDTHADPRFRENPLVVGEPHIRFYAGAPLITPGGAGLGTICVIDNVPRSIGQEETRAIRVLAREVMTQMELRRTLLEVEERTAVLDTFSSSVAHDLRAPLRAVTGFADLLREEYSGKVLTGEGEALLGRMVEETGRMDALIKGLLAYARIARQDLPLERVPLGPLVDEVLHDLATDIGASKAVVDVAPILPHVRAHPLALRQVVLNLISNAIKFVPPGATPRVKVTAETEGDRVVLRVADNGIGIPVEVKDRLFKPFSRLHGQEGAYPGTGIGLAIAQKAAERMGGRVGVDSEPGKGSTFWIELSKGGDLFSATAHSVR